MSTENSVKNHTDSISASALNSLIMGFVRQTLLMCTLLFSN